MASAGENQPRPNSNVESIFLIFLAARTILYGFYAVYFTAQASSTLRPNHTSIWGSSHRPENVVETTIPCDASLATIIGSVEQKMTLAGTDRSFTLVYRDRRLNLDKDANGTTDTALGNNSGDTWQPSPGYNVTVLHHGIGSTSIDTECPG